MQNNADSSQPTIEQLIQFLAHCTRDHFERSSRGVQGSFLANMLRHEFPGFDYSALGLAKLGDLVRIAEDRGLVRRNPNVQHLELTPGPQSNASVSTQITTDRREDLLFVVPDIWRAVVFWGANTRSFFNRTTGAITEIGADSPRIREVTADAALVEIERVSQEAQIQWLKEFLSSRGRPEASDQGRLTELLRGGIYGLGSALAQDWKFLRSRKVVEHVRRWAERHSIDPAAVLVPPRKSLPQSGEVPSVGPPQASDAAIRRAVLAIVHEMTLAELETLSLPLRHVLRHFTVK